MKRSSAAVVSSQLAVRFLWTTLGCALVGLGFVGYAVPGMPSTILFILALFCFKKGNARFEAWLLNHPWFGSTLRDWDENRWMTRKAKVLSVGIMWLFMAGSMALIGSKIRPGLPAQELNSKWIALVAISLCGIGVTWYIATRRTKPDSLPEII
jgi:uncharacterized membrane protein YbaN (DUF454 family)